METKSGSGEKTPQALYDKEIRTYKSRVKELNTLKRRQQKSGPDNEILNAIQVIDEERHAIHTALIELGKGIGKSKDDVLVDIIRKEGTLENYGLPEFSILTENEIIDTGDWHNPFYFNIDYISHKPGDNAPDTKFYTGESIIKPGEVMIVYAIVPITNYGADEHNPEDFEERVLRAEVLAKEVGGHVFHERDSGYHEAYAKILGVKIANAQFESVLAMIRDNPKKFRIGEAFYSDEAALKAKVFRNTRIALAQFFSEDEHFLEHMPEPIQGTEILKKYSFVMFDDSVDVFDEFIPHLMLATDGKMTFIQDEGKTPDAVARQIIGSGADVALVDMHLLSTKTDGTDVARALKKQGFKGKVIGFSSDKRADAAFKAAGALGSAEKDADYTKKSVLNIAKLLEGTG